MFGCFVQVTWCGGCAPGGKCGGCWVSCVGEMPPGALCAEPGLGAPGGCVGGCGDPPRSYPCKRTTLFYYATQRLEWQARLSYYNHD
ncbi:jg11998 [Pararge aegeria aegeria]|uniref:Jg11998 protein n=1 Tax=Pararge aegeria aegeria TaxID=348720 RepID=A0A8S4R605_9NEOP|nr:jg11998 [Pararge aegeria aegeria]